MRKFTQVMLVLLAFLCSTIGAVAQNYPVNVSTTETRSPSSRFSNRTYSGVSIQPERGAKQTSTINNYVYADMTGSTTFTVKTGQKIYPRFTINSAWGDGAWMQSFIFVDKGKDGQFNVSSLNDASDDLVEHYRKNSDSCPFINSIPAFAVPETPGTYRMRYLVYWYPNESTTPAPGGSSGMNSDGGIIVDVNLQVEYPTIETIVTGADANVTYSGNPICGQDFTFTAPDKFGFTKTVTVKCGENFNAERTTTTVSYYNGSSTQVSETCYNWESITPNDNGDGTYTVPADKMKGDLQITVTYTKDVMALIKAGKQVFRIKNVDITDYPYLKVATADASSGSKFSEGDKILYHVDEATATANGASCLWRLMPVGTNQYYLRSQCLTLSDMKTTNSSGSTNGNCPVKMAAAFNSEGNAQGQIIYLHQTNSNYGFSTSSSTTGYNFMHAVVHGGPSSTDGNYPATQNGYYVTTWNKSATASQWTLEEVNEIGITIGASGYASVNYDFPVKFPAGVKVYKKALEAATYIKLEEIPAGSDGCVSLPTGNAAFVAGTPGASITLEILLDEPEAIEGGTGVNGTYLATTFDATSAANIYGIANVDGVVAFYKMRANTTIKQNKGYIESATSSAPRMELTFGEGPTTGIESVFEDNSRRESIDTSVLYDLNGRRVLYPSRGIYVTAGGQRIFLK